MDLDAMIADAEAKLHALYTGRGIVKVLIEGQETEFSRVSIPQLEGYIAKLKARKAGQRSTGAIGFWF